jgi:putative oxidoreductase
MLSGQRTSLTSRVLATHADFAPTVARVMLGIVMFPHGAQKLFGWFGGYGWEGTMGFMMDQIGLPAPFAAGLILLESIGSVLLLLGLFTRPIALGFIGIMLGAIFSVHAQFGFFMNWFGAQKGEGFEYHLLVIALAAVLVVRGGGNWSVDGKLAR